MILEELLLSTKSEYLKRKKMKVKNVELPIEEIKAFCDRWQVIEFALFGSVIRRLLVIAEAARRFFY
jgi:predicted nucleotidyltransferase